MMSEEKYGEQLTKDQAIELFESEVWKDWTNEEKVRFQLFQDRLCMPFSKFHEAIEDVLNRPVYTHEFAWRDQLIREYLGEREKPTLEEVFDLIPEEKRIILKT